jgi:hypothetical protein
MPRGQGHLVGGIDLPDIMHRLGPRGRVVARTTRGRPAQAGLAQPAPQAAARGQRDAGKMSAQDQADQLGSPGGVFLTEGLRLQDERLGGTGASGRPVIGRRGRLSAVILAEAE